MATILLMTSLNAFSKMYEFQPVLETKASLSVWDRQLLVRTRNFLHISLQINVLISQNSGQDRQLFQLSPEHWFQLRFHWSLFEVSN